MSMSVGGKKRPGRSRKTISKAKETARGQKRVGGGGGGGGGKCWELE